MDVILLEKIHKLGDLGDQVKVKSGFGRNYLIPSGKAVSATAENITKFEAKRAELEKQHQATLDALDDSQLAYYLSWFATLPTHLDLGNLRIVHACWDPTQLAHITHTFANHDGFDTALLTAASNPVDAFNIPFQ